MNYQECPHYNEIVKVLSEGRDLEDISFEIDEVRNCKECTREGNGVCSLWVSLTFIQDMKTHMSIADAKATIDTLDEQMEKIALQLIGNLNKNSDDNS